MRSGALPCLLLCVAQLTSAAQTPSAAAATPAPLRAFSDSRPVWALDGESIAFTRTMRGQPTVVIASVRADGSNVRRLTEIHSGGHPAWSPDRSTIAYLDTRRNGSPEVWLIDPDGSDRRELTRRQHAADPGAAWSADGRAIAFADPLVDVIYVINADASNVRPVTPHHCSNRTVAWSPHGREIAVQGDCGLFIVNANVPATRWAAGDGGSQRSLSRMGGFTGRFAWSPDGRMLAFSSKRHAKRMNRCAHASEIYGINADGTNLRRLTRYPDVIAYDSQPVWSPDGRTIVYQHKSDYVQSPGWTGHGWNDYCGYSKTDLWAMDADGSNQRPLTRDGRGDYFHDAAWSPDSRTIAFSKAGRIHLMNADGSHQHPIT